MSNFDSQTSESILFIDVGNSSIKVGFKSDNKWKSHTHKTAVSAANQINNHTYPVHRINLSSVREAVKDSLKNEIESHLIREITIKEIPSEFLDYQTPDTLGIDRYLVCLGARAKTNKAVVVIDAGSACTIDYMDEQGVFRGGVIMPGLQAILTIFEKKAPELPEIELKLPSEFPGKSTKTSLENGLTQFFVDGINSHIYRYSEYFGEFDLFVTGGDADFIQSLNFRTMTINKNLIFEGMDRFFEQ